MNVTFLQQQYHFIINISRSKPQKLITQTSLIKGFELMYDVQRNLYPWSNIHVVLNIIYNDN